MNKKQPSPCAECPFRKKSLKGYVGPHENAKEIVGMLKVGMKFPCHMEASSIAEHLVQGTGGEDEPLAMSAEQAYRQAVIEAPHCVGALAMMNNSLMLSRDMKTAAEQQRVGKRDDVFASEAEMYAYHDDTQSRAVRATVKNVMAGRVPKKKSIKKPAKKAGKGD